MNPVEICPGCKRPVTTCPYGGDCLEVDAIYRAQQREKLKDIDIESMPECPYCRHPTDDKNGCYECLHDPYFDD